MSIESAQHASCAPVPRQTGPGCGVPLENAFGKLAKALAAQYSAQAEACAPEPASCGPQIPARVDVDVSYAAQFGLTAEYHDGNEWVELSSKGHGEGKPPTTKQIEIPQHLRESGDVEAVQNWLDELQIRVHVDSNGNGDTNFTIEPGSDRQRETMLDDGTRVIEHEDWKDWDWNDVVVKIPSAESLLGAEGSDTPVTDKPAPADQDHMQSMAMMGMALGLIGMAQSMVSQSLLQDNDSGLGGMNQMLSSMSMLMMASSMMSLFGRD